ncbi:uncharacterized protein LOC130768342 [Actinidia eriantha]|uniref:uncharacterized protein LOC130768342 n=1 Tax=Actinidia eriantha TaxID=165200 RepID=UPI002584AFD4|nr:uncharacterized protein LOC130768342 [Actinidia eriantha]
MSTAMEHRRNEAAGHDFDLREWAVKTKMVSRENTKSRRFSASYITSFREDTRSFRSNITISSTASSPGYTGREEIDPSTYSFTAALKALQARSAYSWECLSPDGLALNSKWNEAEKYICNPLSGQVPLECLSAKTLSERLFPNMAGRITISAPLVYPSHSRLLHKKPSLSTFESEIHFPVQEKRVASMTRDVGTQSTPPELSSGSTSPSPAPTPSIEERSIKQDEAEIEDSSSTNLENLINFEKKVELKETREREETKRKEQQNDDQQKRENAKQTCRQGGCLSWRSFLCMKKKQFCQEP